MTRPEFLTTEEVAELLRMPSDTVRDWRHRHVGPVGFRVGRHVRYDLADVLRWVKQRQEEEPSTAGKLRAVK